LQLAFFENPQFPIQHQVGTLPQWAWGTWEDSLKTTWVLIETDVFFGKPILETTKNKLPSKKKLPGKPSALFFKAIPATSKGVVFNNFT